MLLAILGDLATSELNYVRDTLKDNLLRNMREHTGSSAELCVDLYVQNQQLRTEVEKWKRAADELTKRNTELKDAAALKIEVPLSIHLSIYLSIRLSIYL